MQKNQAPRQAFIQGFWKGMAAPLSLYSRRPPVVPKPEFQELPVRAAGSVAEDWQSIGDDLRAATKRAVDGGL